MTLLQKIQNLKWTPDLPYKLKEILLELFTKSEQPYKVFRGLISREINGSSVEVITFENTIGELVFEPFIQNGSNAVKIIHGDLIDYNKCIVNVINYQPDVVLKVSPILNFNNQGYILLSTSKTVHDSGGANSLGTSNYPFGIFNIPVEIILYN